MAINTQVTKPIQVKENRYQGVTPFQERALTFGQTNFNNLQTKLYDEILDVEYDLRDADLFKPIQEDFQKKQQEISENFTNVSQIQDTRDGMLKLRQIKNNPQVQAFIKRKEDYATFDAAIASQPDADNYNKELRINSSQNNQLVDEQGNININPTKDITIAPEPEIVNMASTLAKTMTTDIKAINPNIDTVKFDNNTGQGIVIMKDGKTTTLDEVKLQDYFKNAIKDSNVYQQWLQKQNRWLDKGIISKQEYDNNIARHERQFNTMAKGITYNQDTPNNTVINPDNIVGGVKAFDSNDNNDDLLNAGANQISVKSGLEYNNIDVLRENKNENDRKFNEIQVRIVKPDNTTIMAGSSDDIPGSGIPVPTNTWKAQKLNPEEKYTIIDKETGQERPMTDVEATTYNLSLGQKLKTDKVYNNAVDDALGELRIGKDIYKKHENFINSSLEQREKILGQSYEDYKKSIDESNITKLKSGRENVVMDTPMSSEEWSQVRYKNNKELNPTGFDIRELDEKIQQKFDKQKYKLVNKEFVTYASIKDYETTKDYQASSESKKKGYQISENRKNRWKNNYGDVLTNLGSIISEKTKSNVIYSGNEDFYEEIFGEEINLEKPINYSQLGYNYDAENGGIEKVQITATNKDGEEVKTLIFGQGSEVDRVASYVTNGISGTDTLDKELRSAFKDKDFVSKHEAGNTGYIIEKDKGGYKATINYIDPTTNQLKTITHGKDKPLTFEEASDFYGSFKEYFNQTNESTGGGSVGK